MTCKPTIETESVWGADNWPYETRYYVATYDPWWFGLLKKSRKLVAVMPRNYHDKEGLLKLLKEVYVDDYKYDENGDLVWSSTKPVWVGSSPPGK